MNMNAEIMLATHARPTHCPAATKLHCEAAPQAHGFDALDPLIREQPWPYYEWLRAHPERRIYKLPQEHNFYLVHRYEDVSAVLSDPDTFSSQIFPDREIPFFPMMKGAEHRRIRDALQGLFSAKSTAQLTPTIEAAIEKQIKTLLSRPQQVELMESWATRIPLRVIASLFGHPTDDASLSRLHDQAVALNTEAFPVGGTGERQITPFNAVHAIRMAVEMARATPSLVGLLRQVGPRGMLELNRYLGGAELPQGTPRQARKDANTGRRKRLVVELIHHLAKLFGRGLEQPDGASVLSSLLSAHRQGQLSFIEMMMAALIIILAGYGTTSNLLACGVWRMAWQPGLLERLRDHPTLIPPYVEELLRCYGPLQRTARRVSRSVQLGGQSLPQDTQLILLLGAANTDPVRFTNAERFNFERDEQTSHIAFGRGIHTCLGSALARLQARLALTSFVQHVESVQTLPNGTDFIVDRDTGMYGFEKLHLQLRARSSTS
jgi:cytochrome P450